MVMYVTASQRGAAVQPQPPAQADGWHRARGPVGPARV